MKYIKFVILFLAIIIAPKVSALTGSNDNTLSSLSLSSGVSLVPSFSPSITAYTASTDFPTIIVNATVTESSKATIVSGVNSSGIALSYGQNILSVVVRSEIGENNTYTINVLRNDTRSVNNNLKGLTISKGSIAFNKSVTTYNITVDQSVTSISASAELDDPKASFANGYGSPQTINNLKYGDDNLIQFRVLAENGETKTYSLTVNRYDGRNSNSYLGSLSLSEGNIVFVKNIQDYSITVPFTTNSIDITASAEDPKATISLSGGNNLAVGVNMISITVTPENSKDKRVYTVLVFKLAKGEVLSSNNYLKSLKVGDYKIILNKSTTKYLALISNDGDIDIAPITDDSNATVTITGNERLKSGSVVTISVIAENGSRRDYKVTVMRSLSPVLLVILVILALSAIVGAIVIIKKRTLKRKKPLIKPEEVISVASDTPTVSDQPLPESTEDVTPNVPEQSDQNNNK